MDRFISALGKAAEYLMKNPYEGVGLIIGASVAKELAAAGIGKAVGAALSTPGGIIVASAALAITTGVISINALTDDLNKDRNASLGNSTTGYADAARVQGKLARGEAVTAEEAPALKRDKSTLDARRASVVRGGNCPRPFDGREGLGEPCSTEESSASSAAPLRKGSVLATARRTTSISRTAPIA